MEHKMQKSIIDDARKHHYLLSTDVVSKWIYRIEFVWIIFILLFCNTVIL